MENMIIVVVLLAAVVLAAVRVKKHAKGGCCGSGSKTIRVHKELNAPKLGEVVLHIEGMHCENCQARVENVLNNLDGVACIVDLKAKTATVSYSREISVEELRDRVEKLDYKVMKVETVDLSHREK